jgi:hypothetical protein
MAFMQFSVVLNWGRMTHDLFCAVHLYGAALFAFFQLFLLFGFKEGFKRGREKVFIYPHTKCCFVFWALKLKLLLLFRSLAMVGNLFGYITIFV